MNAGNQVRTVIELLCKILDDNRICSLQAETVRQAKFNNVSATQPLWILLCNVISFCKTHSTTACFQEESSEFGEKEVRCVKSEMQNMGYLTRSFAQLPNDMSRGSRELLLALAWVIHTQKLVVKILAVRSSPLQQQLMKFLNIQTNSVKGLPATAWDKQTLSVKEKVQFQLMMCGKLRLALRRLYMVSQQRSRLTRVINESTIGVTLHADRNHLTPLEVHLLKYPESLQKMLSELEGDNEQLQNLLDWREKEHIFWEWMINESTIGVTLHADRNHLTPLEVHLLKYPESLQKDSVLTLHFQEKTTQPRQDSVCDEEIYLPLPPAIGQRITTTRSSLRDFILQHESLIDRMEQLVLRKKVSAVELEVLSHHMDRELSGLAHKLQCCGRGEDQAVDTEHGAETAVDDPGGDNPVAAVTGQEFRSRSVFLKQSARAVPAKKQAQVLEQAKSEIHKLESNIQQLERELKERQVENLNKLGGLVEEDLGLICVQPAVCKHLFPS